MSKKTAKIHSIYV